MGQTFVVFSAVIHCRGALCSVLVEVVGMVWHWSGQGVGADSLHGKVGEVLQIASNVAVVIGVPLATLLAILGLRQLNETRVARHTEVTLRLFEMYQSDHMRDVMACVRKPALYNPEGKLDYASLKADDDAEKCFIDMGNYFELISSLASSRQLDPGAASALFGDMLKHFWAVSESAVLEYRKLPGFGNMWKPWQNYVKDLLAA